MTFIPNPNFADEIQRQPEFKAGLAERAVVVRDVAKSIAPVESGAYRDSIQVKGVGGRIYLTATDFKAWWIEYGTAGAEGSTGKGRHWRHAHTPTFATLRRSVKESGLRLDEQQRSQIGRTGFNAVIPNV